MYIYAFIPHSNPDAFGILSFLKFWYHFYPHFTDQEMRH